MINSDAHHRAICRDQVRSLTARRGWQKEDVLNTMELDELQAYLKTPMTAMALPPEV